MLPVLIRAKCLAEELWLTKRYTYDIITWKAKINIKYKKKTLEYYKNKRKDIDKFISSLEEKWKD